MEGQFKIRGKNFENVNVEFCPYKLVLANLFVATYASRVVRNVICVGGINGGFNGDTRVADINQLKKSRRFLDKSK